MKISKAIIFLAPLLLLLSAAWFCGRAAKPVPIMPKTITERLTEFGPSVDARMAPLFHAQGIEYPAAYLTIVGLKAEKTLEIYAANNDKKFKLIKSYPMLAASGVLGPKLREGDLQVPEGLYRIALLNPNSKFHLSLRVNYPNEFDRAMAQAEGRSHLGGDIMIHGNAVSIGCIAIGDRGAEDLFIIAARTGIEHISVILSPVDFRVRALPDNMPPLPKWIGKLYPRIEAELKKYSH